MEKISKIKWLKQKPELLKSELKSRDSDSDGPFGSLTDKLVWKASQNRAMWWKKYNEAIVKKDEVRAQKLKNMLKK